MLSRFILLLILVIFTAVTGALLPLPLTFVLGGFALVVCVLLNLYPDKFLLHYLQARETIETDYPAAYRLARAQAHKLKIEAPKIYTYSGFFHRAFAFCASDRVAFVIEKKVLEFADDGELEALFFSLGCQVHQKLAARHTLALLVMSLVWAPALKLQSPRNDGQKASSWMVQFLVAPFAGGLYRLMFPTRLWGRYLQKLAAYTWESRKLVELTAKLEQPNLELSAVRVFRYRFYAANHSAAQQMILAIEGAHHVFDSVGRGSDLSHA